MNISNEELYALYLENGRMYTTTAAAVGCDESTVRRRLTKWKADGGSPEVVVQHPSNPDVPIAELIEFKKRRFARKKTHEDERKLIKCTIKCEGPIGILHFGDPHLDNDGTDIALYEQHCQLVLQTKGLYAANVGDVTDNWVGRLARLYADSSTTEHDAWRLAEYFMNLLSGKLIYLIGGNHDAWSGNKDPLKWIMRSSSATYQPSEARIEVHLPNKTTFRINARHDFAGSSQYNPAHGPTKALQFGTRDHIAICGHKHKSGHSEIKCPQTGINMQAVQVGSYKMIDRFARDHGFRDQHLSPCCVTIVNPELPDTHPDFIKVYWDAEHAARVLTALRESYGFGT